MSKIIHLPTKESPNDPEQAYWDALERSWVSGNNWHYWVRSFYISGLFAFGLFLPLICAKFMGN